MKTDDFDYYLPEELIAQVPLEHRESSRLLVLDKNNGNMIDDRFYDIVSYLNRGDVLVLNDTKVMPARIIGVKSDTGAVIEVLLLKNINGDRWECLVKPAKRVKIGTIITFGNGELKCECVALGEDGIREFNFIYDGIFYEILDKLGSMPLPPYIKVKLDDKDRYQTVYAKYDGSAAAPTAGLHFTEELLEKIKEKGIEIANVTLHVGIGTFRPVKEDTVEAHKMHSEHFYIKQEDVDKINKAKEEGRRVIAVGTTSCRVLESVADEKTGKVRKIEDDTEIFIYPGYKFKCIDGLITNFHLPQSTLLMLVSALADKEFILQAYNEAVKEKYRFFSFGDAMLII